MSAAPDRLVVASYNVHRCVGGDRRRRPQRVVEALRQLDADAVGLQEIDSRDGAPEPGDLLGYLCRQTGLQAVEGPAIFHPDGGFFGNLLLTRLPVEDVRVIDLAVEGREPRTALDVDLRTEAGLLRVVSTHLGLARRERRLQVDRLLAALQRLRRPVVVVLGDFNEWVPVNRSTLRLDRVLGATARPPTFPAWRPLLPLDRIWVHPSAALEELRALVTPLTRRASDHLPLYVRLRLGAVDNMARG